MADDPPVPPPGATLAFGRPGAPLVVVAHDWHGRLPWIERYGAALAARRLRVLVVDLFAGRTALDDDRAARLMRESAASVSLGMVEDALMQGREEGSARAGVIGFSMGGWLALQTAAGGRVDAVVAYYATLEAAEHGLIPCPVLLHLAEHDSWLAPGAADDFVARLGAHSTPVVRHDYPGTGHGFANAAVERDFAAPSAALAFERTAAFLQEHLAA